MRLSAAILSLTLWAGHSLSGQACPPPVTISSALRVADYAFLGRVLSVTNDSVFHSLLDRRWYSPARHVTFKVVRQWLGLVKDTVQLHTDPDDSQYVARSGRVPLPLLPGTDYLVLASSGGGFVSGKDTIHYRALIDRPWTNSCMGTRLSDSAGAWIRLLDRDPIEILEIDSLVRP